MPRAEIRLNLQRLKPTERYASYASASSVVYEPQNNRVMES